MKIKVAYGIDTRLWRHGQNLSETVVPKLFDNLLRFVIETFNLPENGFLIQVVIDGKAQPLSSQKELEMVIIAAQKANNKSVKVHVIELESETNDDMELDNDNDEDDQLNDDEKEVIDSGISKTAKNGQDYYDGPGHCGEEYDDIPEHPSREEIDTFLQNPEMIALVSDLICDVLVALKEIGFGEMTFMECLNGVLLSDCEKYKKLTDHAIWSFFVEVLLANHVHKIEQFLVPMIQMNGKAIDTQMIKAWVPSLMNMIIKFGYDCPPPHHRHRWGRNHHGRGTGRGWWGRHRGRGGRWKKRCGASGGGRWKGRHHGRKHGHKRGGRRGRHHGHAHGPHHGGYHNGPHAMHEHPHGSHGPPPAHHGRHHPYHHGPPPPHAGQCAFGYGYAPQNVPARNDENDGGFKFTEELSEIMGMGFDDFLKIKQLLNENNGNKQRVVQQLIATK